MNDNRMLKMILAVVGTFVVLWLVSLIGPSFNESLQLDETATLRFVFVGVGLLILFAVYWFTSDNAAWEIGTREVVYMAIGAALYAVFSWLFNGTVFAVPSVSQVALRPAIAIPMFFGYAFGPVVGFFTGAVGNMFGDALTGFGLSPQWSVGNGLVGMIAGMGMLFTDKKKAMNNVFVISAIVIVIATVLYFMNSEQANMMFFDPDAGIFGDAKISIFAALAAVIGFVLVLGVRYFFSDEDIKSAVSWSMLGNFLGIGFAAISDIWINGFSLPVAVVGEYLPAAGPNMIFAVILVPILLYAWKSFRTQTGR
jgi:uncharacterized membrane protein